MAGQINNDKGVVLGLPTYMYDLEWEYVREIEL